MTLADIILQTVAEEGVLSDHPADPGGITKYGQTIPWLTDLYGRGVTREEVIALTLEQALDNYKRFAIKTRIADVATLHPKLGAILFDFAINSGHKNAIRAMQRAIDTSPDGVIGSRTLERLRDGGIDETNVATEVLASRLETYARIVRGKHPFIAGWLLRVARQLRNTW